MAQYKAMHAGVVKTLKYSKLSSITWKLDGSAIRTAILGYLQDKHDMNYNNDELEWDWDEVDGSGLNLKITVIQKVEVDDDANSVA